MSGQKTVSPIKQARKNLTTLLAKLNEHIVGHEEVNKMLLVTLIAHENAVMIAPPGTAKTYTIEMLSKLLDAKFYKYLITRFTTDIELFGVYNVKRLIDEGKLIREWSKIVDADIIFFDEIFKASSAILNTLLSLLNERRLYDPYTGQEVPVKAISVFAASNEVPTEEELQALYDRFAVRIFMRYLDADDLILKALEARWLKNGKVKPVASLDDVETLHRYAMEILTSEIEKLGKFINVYHVTAVPHIKALRARGIIVSDRTIIEKLPKLVAAYCALFGLTIENLTNGVIDILPYLAREESEVEAIKKAIFEDMGEVAELYNTLERARIAMKSGNLKEAEELLHKILNFDIEKISKKPWLKPRVETIIREARETLEKIGQIRKTLEEIAGLGK